MSNTIEIDPAVCLQIVKLAHKRRSLTDISIKVQMPVRTVEQVARHYGYPDTDALLDSLQLIEQAMPNDPDSNDTWVIDTNPDQPAHSTETPDAPEQPPVLDEPTSTEPATVDAQTDGDSADAAPWWQQSVDPLPPEVFVAPRRAVDDAIDNAEGPPAPLSAAGYEVAARAVLALHQDDGNGQCTECFQSMPCITRDTIEGAISDAEQHPEAEPPAAWIEVILGIARATADPDLCAAADLIETSAANLRNDVKQWRDDRLAREEAEQQRAAWQAELDQLSARCVELQQLLKPRAPISRSSGTTRHHPPSKRGKGAQLELIPNPRDVRAWAAQTGIDCPSRGRIPGVVLSAYLARAVSR